MLYPIQRLIPGGGAQPLLRNQNILTHFTSTTISKNAKTYNSGDSLVVTHLTTSPPVHCLYMAERTGGLILSVLVCTNLVDFICYELN